MASDFVDIGKDIVRSLYKSLLACADHHDPEILRRIHIPTAIDDAIVMAAKQDKVVIVTGNTGDGKTHLVRQVGSEFSKSIAINKDANEVEDEELIRTIDKAVTNRKALILAINEGILLDVCEQAKAKCPWAPPVIDAILRPFVYADEAAPDLGQIVILDLNLRNNLSPDVIICAIDRVVSLAEHAGEDEGTLAENIASLRHPIVKGRITHLLDTVGKTGFHATMREVLGFVAYLICGGADEEAAAPAPYYVNAFEGGQGPLFDKAREFDPLLMPSPFLDDQLYMVQDADTDWEIERPGEMRVLEDLGLFRERKRRAFFEHVRGRDILRAEGSDVERAFQQLTRADQSPEHVAIRLLNRFYDAKDTQTDQLTLWVSHQYNARPTRFVASRQSINASEFVVRIPRLPAHLKGVFKDYYPDHVVLCHRSMGLGAGLVIDRRLVAMLIAGDRMSGLGSRNLEAQTKVAAFYDALAKTSTNQQSVVQVLRLDNMTKAKIGVNVSTREYYLPGGGL
jgi:hypothetical protein